MANKKQPHIIKFKDETITEVIIESLIRHGKVKVSRFGIFTLKRMKERRGVNPHTGEQQLFKEYTKVSFTPVAKLKEAIQIWK